MVGVPHTEGGIRVILLGFCLVSMGAACSVDAAGLDPEGDFYEGEGSDNERHSLDDKEDRPLPYEIPDDLPTLVAPEIIVSLSQRTVHLFDRATGVSRIYPTGVGVKSSRTGRSITPTGHYATSPDSGDGWYYIPSRWSPAYFEGYPFLRLNIKNSAGAHTYGLHGPITNPLQRGFVSHGCMRMDKRDIVELFYMVKDHPSTPVTIQEEPELDANGAMVDVGAPAALYAPDAAIAFGVSVGPRPARIVPRNFIGEACGADDECGDGTPESLAFCHPAGFCTEPCAQYCPDRAGRPGTFCADSPSASGGLCMRRVDESDPLCAAVPNTVAREVPNAAIASRVARVCAPATL
jgi:hypothetical protein